MSYSVTNESDGVRVRWEYDEAYATLGSYALETEGETRAAENHECEMLASGAWVALSAYVEVRGDGDAWEIMDDLHGIVIGPDDEELESFAAYSLQIPARVATSLELSQAIAENWENGNRSDVRRCLHGLSVPEALSVTLQAVDLLGSALGSDLAWALSSDVNVVARGVGSDGDVCL